MDDKQLREIPFSSETIYDGAILRVEKWQVTCPNGHTAPREIVVHKGAAAVVKGAVKGTLDEEQAAQAGGAVDAYFMGDRTEWIAKADTALAPYNQ